MAFPDNNNAPIIPRYGPHDRRVGRGSRRGAVILTNWSQDLNVTPAVGIGLPPDWPNDSQRQKAHDDALAAALAVDPALADHLPPNWPEWRYGPRCSHFRNVAEWGGPLPAYGPNDTAANDGRSFMERLADYEAARGNPRDESFMQRKAKRDAAKAAAAANGESSACPDIPPLPPVDRPTAGGYRDQAHPYVQTAIKRELLNLSTAVPGTRNSTLNNAALKLGRLSIDRQELTAYLIKACNANGLVRDDGMGAVLKTIRSAFGKADREGQRVVPDLEPLGTVSEVEYETLAPKRDESTGGEDGDGDRDESARREQRIQREVAQMLEKNEARRRFDALTRPPAKQPTAWNISDLFAENFVPVDYRIERVAPVGSRVLLAAQYKAGKSTLVGNVIRNLADGDPFLGRFEVNARPVHIVLIDTELSPRMLQKWLQDQGIERRNVTVYALRETGVSVFNILDERVRAQWAARLRDLGADYLILDCLRPCLDALGLSEDKEAGRFLTAFDQLLADANIGDALVVHHMGHSQERSRGDSRLLDWPDALWYLNRADPDDPTSARYFKAVGRDVNVAEGLLAFDPATRHLTYSDGSRKARAADAALIAVVDVLREHHAAEGPDAPGIPKTRLTIDANAGRNAATKAIEKGLRTGLLTAESGSVTSSKMIRLTNPCDRCGGPLRAGQVGRHLSCQTDSEEWLSDAEI